MSAAKVLFCGPVEGNLGSLAAKVAAVNKKSGPFAALFCTGAFFPNDGKGMMQFVASANASGRQPRIVWAIAETIC